jgi:cation-transporting P-type ATPase E
VGRLQDRPGSTAADAGGLTSAEVAERVAAGQVNDVSAVPSRTVGQIVRGNVLTPFNALLGTMLVLILIVGPIQDALFGVVLVANIAIGVIQEVRAKRTLDSLAILTAAKAQVVRDGKAQEIDVGSLVLGDLIEVAPGDQMAVDAETVSSDGLEIDESLVTGESEPIAKPAGSQVLSGSFVVAGSGSVRATGVGSNSYAARLGTESRRFTLTRSELRDGINEIIRFVSVLIVPTAILLIWSQLVSQHSWRRAIAGAVAGTVAMVPEGLVLLMSIAFAVAVIRLGRQRVLVQELPAVEVLARVDVLCIDKTGTLTDGVIEVERVVELDPSGDPARTGAALAALAAADHAPNATMRAIAQRFPDPEQGWSGGESVAFSSARKWSAVSFDGHGAWVLGAPEILQPNDAGLSRKVGKLAGDGKRVVMLETCPKLEGQRLPAGAQPVALVVLVERIRPQAAATLAYFAAQDVAVKVISGDDPRTVGAVASRLGLAGADDPIDARGLPEDAAALAGAMETHSVFGRVTPQQKRAMVAALQSRGHTVAMTGDGVNDALALKDADIGVAMGSGSQATRAVAQLVLLDSDFAPLPSVVAEGRRVLGNIERTAGLYLTKTSYAMLLALAVGVGRYAFPFLPRHLTLVAGLTIGIPSFFLALAPNSDLFRPGFVRRVLRFAVPAGALAGIATLIAYNLARHEPGLTLGEARTTAVITLTFIGLLILSIVASPFRGWRQALVWSMAGLFVGCMLLPATREFFALKPPPLLIWLSAIGIAAIVWSFARLLVPGAAPVGPRGAERRPEG